jgi:uncharacterized protein (DUF2236 family)
MNRAPAAPGAESSIIPSESMGLTRRVNGERLVILGWGRAVLLQFAHPLVAAGVADYSGFRSSPREKVARFRRTLGAMLQLTYGTPGQAHRAARGIDAIHGVVRGRLREPTGVFPAGTPYAARDPALLRWVHATLLESTLLTHQLLIGPLSRAEQDRYCAEARSIGPLLGVDPDTLPRDTGQLAAYTQAMYTSGQIVVGPTARRLVRDLLDGEPGLAGLVDLPLRLPYRLVTAGLLPPALRAAYGLGWSPARQLAFDGATAACRHLVPYLPSRVRRWPEARAAGRGGSGRDAVAGSVGTGNAGPARR